MGNEIAKLFVTLGLDDKSFISKINKTQKSLSQAGKIMTGIGVGITASLGVATKLAADFDTAMREVNTMMQLSDSEFEAFSDEVKQMSTRLGVDAVKSAEALYQAISAGVPKENAIDFLQVATKAAIGGVTDTETAVDGLSTVLNAFKIPVEDAEKVADIMFTTVKNGKTTFEELSASLFNVAPIAASAGIGFEEVSAAVATMSKQGIKTATATTQLRQVVASLIKPTADMGKVLEKLGYESGEAMLEELGLAGTLNKLREATGGSNEMLGKMFGSVEGLSAVLSLTGENATTFAADIEAMADSSSASVAAFEQMEKGAGRTLESIQETIKGLASTIGDNLLPILKEIIDKIKPIIQKIVDWIQQNPQLTKTIVIIVAAIGVLLTVLGLLLYSLPMLAAGFTLLLGPVGLVIAAVIALAALATLIVMNWEGIKNFFVGLWLTITDAFGAAWDWLKENWPYFLGLPGLIFMNWDKITGFFNELWNSIKNIFSAAWEAIKSVAIDPIVAAVDRIIDIWNEILPFFEGLWISIKGIFNKIAQAMYEPIRNAINYIIDMANQMIRAVNEAIGKIGIRIPEIPFKMPELPAFKTGAIIKKETIARVGEVPEVIAPLDKLPSLLTAALPSGFGSGTNLTINIDNFQANNRSDIDYFAQRIVNEARRRGGFRF